MQIHIAGSLSALSGMTQMKILNLYNNQLIGVSPGDCCALIACLSVLSFCGSMFLYHVLQFVLFDVHGDAGSLAPLSGMTGMTDLELNNNQLTGASARLLCF